MHINAQLTATVALKSQHMFISVLSLEHLALLMSYESENREHLSQWEPRRTADYFSQMATQQRIESSGKSFQTGRSICFVGLNEDKSRIICMSIFSNITHGVFQACNLGYSICQSEQGKGLMFEFLQKCIEYVFKEYDLHRIMANYLPTNIRSENLLKRLGFEKEGLAKSYLKIAGTWQDHVLTSKINS